MYRRISHRGPTKKANEPVRHRTQDSIDQAQGGPIIRVVFDGKRQNLTPDDLGNQIVLRTLLVECNKAASSRKIYLDDLLRLDDRDRFRVLEFASLLRAGHYVVGKKKYRSLLEALLHLPFRHNSLETYTPGKSAILEAAVICHPRALEACAERIRQKLKDAGAAGIHSKSIVAECRRIEKALAHGSGHEEATGTGAVRDHYSEAPVDAQAAMPAGWRATPAGIARGGIAGVVIAPVFITERGTDDQRRVEIMGITWQRDGQWQVRAVDRAQLADSRSIVGLAAYGVPVTSNTAKHLVQFLAEYETANLEHLPRVRVTSRMGWQGEDGGDGFLWGRQLITPDGRLEAAGDVRFQSNEAGVEQLADGLHSRGTLQGWLAAVKRVDQYPRATLTLYTSFAPPMLALFRTQNFGFDLAGPTTTGKTSALRLAASVWGAAHEAPEGSMLGTWDSTAVWRERAPEILNNLPLILDETKHARRAQDVAGTIYSVAQGRGRGRGTIRGIAHQGTWSTVLMSSGEQPLTSFTEDGGTRARVLALWGSPFGATTPETGRNVARITTALRSHYGHAGPEFVRYVAEQRSRWDEWRQQFQEREKYYQQRGSENTVAARMAPHLAAIYVASRIAHEALKLPWGWTDPIEPLYEELTSQAADADRSAAALRHVYSWACGNAHRFWCPATGLQKAPYLGWAGAWQRKPEPDEWTDIAFLLPVLQEVLRQAGFDPTSIIRQWKDRGWLLCNKESKGERNTKRMRLDGKNVRLVVVRRTALEEIGELAGGKSGNAGGNRWGRRNSSRKIGVYR